MSASRCSGGLRRGEIFGLQWADIERHGGSGGRIRVRRSVSGGKVTLPKTVNSERTVDVPASVLAALDCHRADCAVESEWIFPSKTGETPLDPDNWYKRRFKKLREAAGLRPSVTLHPLRHTYASILIRQGENPKYVSVQMGHASVAFTLDVYGHLFQSQSSEAMTRLEAAIPAVVEKEARPPLRVVRGGAA